MEHFFLLFKTLQRKAESALIFFFTTAKEPFLAVSNLDYSANSVIYEWKNNTFEKFQEIASRGCRASTAFVIYNESYIAFANEIRSASSVVYKRAGMHFVKLQNLQKHRTMDVKSFYINCDVFLAIASQPESYINKWNGSQFVQFKTILTSGARALHPFVMCGQTFLGVADQYRTKTELYRFSAPGQFTKYQELSTFGASDMTSFKHKGHTYLAIANFGKNQRNIESTVYKWTLLL